MSEIACISGSIRFEEEMRRVAVTESLRGRIVLMPHVNMRRYDPRWADISEYLKRKLDRLHLEKIDLADVLIVVCPGGYIGESTQLEIEYAADNGMPVEYRRQAEAVMSRG